MEGLKISIPVPDCTLNHNDLSENNSSSRVNMAGSPTRNKIDYTKFKTKTCRNYRLGLPCPFEDRCAFAHGKERATDILSPESPNHSHSPRFSNSFTNPSSPLQRQGPVFGNNSSVCHASKDNNCHSTSGSSSSQDASLPPSYKDSVPPPAYPKKFRNDPYSFSGPVYIH